MERTKILSGTDRSDQLSNTNNFSRSRLVLFFSSNQIYYFLFNRGNLSLTLPSRQQSQSSDNKQLPSTEPMTDEITPTHPDISFP